MKYYMVATQEQNIADRSKISPEFAGRLTSLAPQDKIRVIVLLQTPITNDASQNRLSRAERGVVMKNIRQSSSEALKRINKIIKDFEGRKLTKQVNSLGSIPIEITVAGVDALAESDAVRFIIEDQGISPLDTSSYKI